MSFRMPAIAVLVAVALVAGCGREAATATPGDRPATLLLSAEDVRVVGLSQRTSGPVITGSLQPERRADLRAEVPAVVLQVLKDDGDAVRRGDLLLRLDDSALRDNLASAEESARAATQALEQAQRQVQRLRTLQSQGMTSMQALEDAEVRANTATSEVAAARARVATARQQLRRTEVRAPFDGVVSERRASAGDTAQVGKELMKVIDPSGMRFEGLVSSDRLHELKVGQAATFRVNGYGTQEFAGRVRRIDAAADPTTRQVAVLVDFVAAASAPRVAGLYAEGHVETGGVAQLALPESAIVRVGEAAHVWRIADGAVHKVSVRLGERDARRGEVVVAQGLADGDRVLRHPSSTLVDGQKVEFAPTASAAAAASAPAVK